MMMMMMMMMLLLLLLLVLTLLGSCGRRPSARAGRTRRRPYSSGALSLLMTALPAAPAPAAPPAAAPAVAAAAQRASREHHAATVCRPSSTDVRHRIANAVAREDRRRPPCFRHVRRQRRALALKVRQKPASCARANSSIVRVHKSPLAIRCSSSFAMLS